VSKEKLTAAGVCQLGARQQSARARAQGREADVVIFSCVRARGAGARIGFLADIRRMNVAITRARCARARALALRARMLQTVWQASRGGRAAASAGLAPHGCDARWPPSAARELSGEPVYTCVAQSLLCAGCIMQSFPCWLRTPAWRILGRWCSVLQQRAPT